MNHAPPAVYRILQRRPNLWDVVALVFVGAVVFGVIELSREFAAPLATSAEGSIRLDPIELPHYAARTTLRMFIAMGASLVFSLAYATAAARSRTAERILIPILDILQSVPVLGYLSFSVTLFLALFPGSILGAELASIFAIFTSQAWNLTFSFFQSLRTNPTDLQEVSRAFGFTPWFRFWKLEVPFALPGLLWNAMMSMSGGWFFVVASEAIVVGPNVVALPGIGSWVALAITRSDLRAIGWAIATMAIVIVLYDQLVFRPLVTWAERFRFEEFLGRPSKRPWLLRFLRHTKVVRSLAASITRLFQWMVSIHAHFRTDRRIGRRLLALPLQLAFLAIVLWGLWAAVVTIQRGIDPREPLRVLGLGLLTLTRVMVLVFLACLVWVPIGVVVGLRPSWAAIARPVAQFLAAFPANLLFPLVVAAIVHFDLRPGVWLSPLMMLGAQWYVLFNVLAGASAYPSDLLDAAANLDLRGRLWWTKVLLPGVFPYVVTGALTAAGGAWNASIIAETVRWGSEELTAPGLGAYITQATRAGDFSRIALGIATMSFFVVLVDRLLWRRLYRFAERRYRLG